jgi:peroxiredoxin
MTAHASLTADLAALRAHYAVHMPADIAAAMGRADAALASSDLVGKALGAGEFAPDFTLLDADGVPVTLSRALRDGPVIVSFYRGGWCPYCNLELRAYQARAGVMRAAGVRLIAVSPQMPDATAETVKANDLGFDVVSDSDRMFHAAFGIAFDLAEELRPTIRAARPRVARPEWRGLGVAGAGDVS